MTRVLVTTISALVTICFLFTIGVQAHPAWGIAVDQQGQVYFSELKNVWKINAQGKLSIFRAGGHTHDLNVDEEGNVYGEQDFSAVWKMTPGGEFSYLFAPTNNPPRGVSIWRDRDGNMYSVEQNNHLKRETLLLKRTPSGQVSVFAGGNYGHSDGKGSLAKFSSIIGMTFGADGSLYLVDNSSIRKVTMDGAVATLFHNVMLESAAGKSAGSSSLFGITVDARGNAFVADYGNRRIVKVTPDGQMTTLVRSEESWFPTGVAERGGELYILEESHTPAYQPIATRVRKATPDGRVTVLATVKANTTSSENPFRDENSSGDTAERVAEPTRNTPYALLGAGIVAFALTFIVWRRRRRVDDRQQKDS